MNESLLDGLSLALCKQSVGLWARDINTAPRMSQARRKHEPILPPSLRAGLEVSLAGGRWVRGGASVAVAMCLLPVHLAVRWSAWPAEVSRVPVVCHRDP